MSQFWAIAQWFIAIPLFLFWLGCFSCNLYVALRRTRRIWDGPSHMPLLGTAAGILLAFLLPSLQDSVAPWRIHGAIVMGFIALVVMTDLIVSVGEAIGKALERAYGPRKENDVRS